MADLLSDSDKESFKGSLLDLFDTFSRNITVHKEPKKVITQINVNTMPGYNESSVPENIEFVPVSSEFPAMVDYGDKQSTETEPTAGVTIPRGQISIKVKQEARDYILNGKTEKIELDSKSFNLISRDAVKYYFGLKLYVFFLEEVQ
tara:strand:- start:61 stop:501 length:441 start_codon:yes stop_codon:yes gene_type:complete